MIIDSDDYGASGVETLFFPGGEPHAKLPDIPLDGRVVLHLKARTWNDVGLGACVWDALHRRRALLGSRYEPVLFMPYSPAARQDKSDGTAPITKGVMTRLFNSGRNVHVFDIHSPLHGYNWRPTNWMPADLKLPLRPEVDFVIAPDRGALSRAHDFMEAYCPNAKLIEASKERNQSDGKLSNYVLPTLNKVGKYLVVDDICDGGGTFNLLAYAFHREEVAAHGAELELFVSHGIFSKGVSQLLEYYKHIYTTDSFYRMPTVADHPVVSVEQNNVTTYSLNPILEMIHNVP